MIQVGIEQITQGKRAIEIDAGIQAVVTGRARTKVIQSYFASDERFIAEFDHQIRFAIPGTGFQATRDDNAGKVIGEQQCTVNGRDVEQFTTFLLLLENVEQGRQLDP